MNTSHEAHLNQRVALLEATFAEIARTRMAGVPVQNAALHVKALGFQLVPQHDDAYADDDVSAACGVLITPWFMNLVWLPLQRGPSAEGVSLVVERTLAGQTFEFIGAHEEALGAFSACSLFSPMFEFVDQAAANDTAMAVLQVLRPLPPQAAMREAPPARRAFLFGRSAAGLGPA